MMDIFGGINEILKTLSSNKGSRVWFFVIIIILLSGGWFGKKYIFPAKVVVTNECDYLIEQNKQLVNFLLDVKTNLDSISVGKPISYIPDESYFMYASFMQDTTKKKMNEKEYQKQVKTVSKQIDSILLKNKKYLDSIEKKKQVKQKSL